MGNAVKLFRIAHLRPMYPSQWVWVTNLPSARRSFPKERKMDVQRASAVRTHTSLLWNLLTAWNRPLASHCCWREQTTSEQTASVPLSNGDSSSKESSPLPCPCALSRHWKGRLLAQGDGVGREKVYVSIIYLWMRAPPAMCLAVQIPSTFCI